ncbi:MAG: aldehyde dehydrogenase family protein [Proteobacteria bacterium]|nr:aldehyde dehydrogenase family protein [Pseudomonadota bacterium]
MPTSISDHIYKMKRHFRSGATKSIGVRLAIINKLSAAINHYEADILKALKLDLGKPTFESLISEIGVFKEELKMVQANIAEWANPIEVPNPIHLFGSESKITPSPKGLVLIIGPWNYPFNLVMIPLLSAIAAGNVVVIKPSELSKATSDIIAKLLKEFLPEDVVYCVQGDASITTDLLKHSWDHVFFTGSTRVGKIIAQACASHLTPCTLELGGKSPCIVDSTANLNEAAKRIVWGKFSNAGQTCVAPDYLLVHESIKDRLVEKIQLWIKNFYGIDPFQSADYGRVINFAHYDRLVSYITAGTAIHGGRRNREHRYIEPTLIDGATIDHPSMNEEIFGPILPILTWNEKGQLLTLLECHQNPLALYLFTKDKDFEDEIVASVPFGGGCINHTLLHLGNPNLPFGGIRDSGIGHYHGKFGFETFSHSKSIFKAGLLDLGIKYPRSTPLKEKLLRFWLK